MDRLDESRLQPEARPQLAFQPTPALESERHAGRPRSLVLSGITHHGPILGSRAVGREVLLTAHAASGKERPGPRAQHPPEALMRQPQTGVQHFGHIFALQSPHC